MKKYIIGILMGIASGIVNVAFLLFAQDIEITVYISSFITWIIIGLLIASSDFKLNGMLKGAFIAVLISLPSFVYTVTNSVFGAICSLIIAIIMGAIIGIGIDKLSNKVKTK